MTPGEDRDSRAALGLRVKTGRAIAIALAGTARSPRFLARSELQLCDRKVFATMQPYHAALKVSEAEGEAIVERARKTVAEIATRSIRDFAEEVHKSGYMLAGVGFVISTDHRVRSSARTSALTHSRAAFSGRRWSRPPMRSAFRTSISSNTMRSTPQVARSAARPII